MNNFKIILMILLVLGMTGCQQAPLKQTGSQPDASGTQTTEATGETITTQGLKFHSEPLLASKYDGTYEGISNAGSVCKFAVDFDVLDNTVKGEGVGTGPAITCEIKLDGIVDDEGSMSGQAKAVYSMSGKVKIEWYLAGPFTGKVDLDNKGTVTIDLKGTGNNCALVMPKGTPCTNNPDKIFLDLEKV